ncbi:hypothetical protein OPT61_g91 [Boeremia exigua]|uniref:Uncharacterized protein n=1 Tax=Boeremia exigua TaxID=749465 RepID=A0ACC2IV73_9PLEO|nr:hypothetical protein OPT61_g91 [Boeremia exigua]
MSVDGQRLQDFNAGNWQHSGAHVDTTNTSPTIAYPSSGAFQHLPVRRTIAGAPAQAHPNSTKIFLRDLPAHCYTLPSVPLNFTIVEILVFLPNWFKNKGVCARFLNNNLTSNVHFMILEEHRNIKFTNEFERDKARKTLADEYRKTMRMINSGWTKAKHVAPPKWDPMLLSMDGFSPDDVSVSGYRKPPSIPFSDLMAGIKKIPQGTNAGDLTRSIQYTIDNPGNYMFPDDLPNILNHIGRTQVTMFHTDRTIVRRYVENQHMEEETRKASSANTLVSPQGENFLPTQEQFSQTQVLAQQMSGIEVPLFADNGVPKNQVVDHQTHRTHLGDSSEQLEMDNLLRPYQEDNISHLLSQPVPSYAPNHLLRDCIEGNMGFDGSMLARAARFAQRPDQLQTNWLVEHVLMLVDLLDTAQLELLEQAA